MPETTDVVAPEDGCRSGGGGADAEAGAAPQAPAMTKPLNLDATLRHMHGRAVYRRYYGAYDPARPGLSMALNVLLLVGCLISAVYWTASGPVVVLSLQSPQVLGGWGGFNIISSILVLALLLFLSHKVGRLESGALNLLTAVFAVLMTVTAIILVVQQKSNVCDKILIQGTASTLQDLLVAAYLVLAAALVAVRGAARGMVPRLAASGCRLVAAGVVAREDADTDDVVLARGVLSPPTGYVPHAPVRAAVLEVVAPGWLACFPPCLRRSSTSVCSYVGEVDGAGRPHGYGEWRDSAYHGEHLRGFWQAGAPVGPFRSRETGSASSFVCLQFAITSNLGHWMTTCLPLPSAQVQPGIVAVEVSVTGVFYHSFPRVREVEISGKAWEPPRRGAKCHGCATPPAVKDDVADEEAPPPPPPPAAGPPQAAAAAPSGASGMISELQQPVALPVAPVLEAGAAAAAEEGIERGVGSEVFMYVHGLGEDFGNGHVRMFAQMIALLELPPHIAPLLFCWPAGVVSCYHPARYLGAEDPRCHAALVAVMRQLAAQGVERVHIACHSMGTRVVLGAVPFLEAEAASGSLPILASTTLLNPDYELSAFVTDAGPRLRRLCPIVTVYGDPADQALLLAEVANAATHGLQKCGPGSFALSAGWRSLMRIMGNSERLSGGKAAAPPVPVAEGQEAPAEGQEAAATTPAPAPAAGFAARWRRSMSAHEGGGRGALPGAEEGAGGGGGSAGGGAAAGGRIRGILRRSRTTAASRQGSGAGASGAEEDAEAVSAWRRAAVVVSIVADEAARVTGVSDVMEWWATRPQRAGGRAGSLPAAGGSLAHGMWRPRRGGGGDGDGAGGAPGLASRDDDGGSRGAASAAGAVHGGHGGHGGGHGAAAAPGKAHGSAYLSLGRRIYAIEAPPGSRALDVDVVDLTCLAVNVPAHRHSVHALNRDVLWDLHSIIARGERAAQRTRRLERIVGNVYSFKTSPAHVHVDLL